MKNNSPTSERPITIIGLPYAGGTQYSYAPLAAGFPKSAKFISIDIPGRGSRIREQLLTDIQLMADDIFERIHSQIVPPYAFFGHSMGTLLAYLITHKISREGKTAPVHLFLSGSAGPSLLRNTRDFLLPEDEFRQKLANLGGMPDAILNDENVLSLFEPILRADFQAVECYEHRNMPPLTVPITVMIGKDEETTSEEALLWQNETSAKFAFYEFEGSHFFIFNHIDSIVDVMVKTLTLNNTENIP